MEKQPHIYVINLTQNMKGYCYEVSVDGHIIDRFHYSDLDSQNQARRLAKSVAWDNALAKAQNKKPFTIEFTQIKP